ncbi:MULTISPECIES: hypothetical protein [Photorhabdus]|uniref:Two-component response regulator n=2 Tax=Photorhabdus asymbiotica TaxID=291112 RepID=C7BJM4_PHOAA|nr:hypothetical protein [Photorhabdus asymbiotica]RKS59411.1 hypothetical protein BDD30_1482 [Photorhabdus asymbiotica]CAQ85549.1 Putative two-component response regulator [Photorhabdus asymbiotica]
MKKSKRHYYKILHYYLVKGFLNEEAFNIITELSDEEIVMWFSLSRTRVSKVIELLSLVAQYQRARLNYTGVDWLGYRKKLLQNYYLWSDAAFFKEIPGGYTSQELGLIVLAAVNWRQAIVWSLRLGVKLPEGRVIVGRPEYLKSLILGITENNIK